jgi:hypothetical protein
MAIEVQQPFSSNADVPLLKSQKVGAMKARYENEN